MKVFSKSTFLPLLVFFGYLNSSFAQQKSSDEVLHIGVSEAVIKGRSSKAGDLAQQTHFIFHRQATFNFAEATEDFQPALLIQEMPAQGGSEMINYVYPDNKKNLRQAKENKEASIPDLVLGQNFLGNPFSVSTPCDNDFAISDSGFIVSVMNTNIFMKNTATNTNFPVKSLAAFTSPINNKHQEFDPKVMYDPLYDRFVLMCMVGFVDTTSKMVVGFSQTNDPTGTWNLYTLPGDALNNGLWSDYPMIAMTEKELFLSVNLLYNDSTWQAGFVETIVWQMDKKSGYQGQPLSSTLHSNIKFNGKAIRNLCPAKGGSKLYKPNMYFVSNRNLASQNDTVFLVNITDTINASTNTVTAQALITPQPYFFPPDGRQTTPTQSLATNDSRNLGAFYENNKIHYVHNTKNPANNFVTVYYGIIEAPQSAAPTVSGYLLPNDTMDFAYPNISYVGTSGTDNASIITFDHSSNKVNAGVSAVQADTGGAFSKVLRIKNGLTFVNLLQSNLERWGDYSGSQRRYNKQGEVWMSGYFAYSYSGSYPWTHAAWIAQLKRGTAPVPVDTTSIDSRPANEPANVSVYPNPSADMFSVSFSIPKPEYLSFELFDLQGRLLTVLLRDWVKVNTNVFTFNTSSLSKGVYYLKISGNFNTNITKKVVIN